MSLKKGLAFPSETLAERFNSIEALQTLCLLLLCCRHRESEPSFTPFVHSKALQHKNTFRPVGIYQPREAAASIWVLPRSVTVLSFPKPRYTRAPNTAAWVVQIYLAYISPLKYIMTHCLHIHKNEWEGIILLFPEPAGKGDYNFLWQYLVASAPKSFLFFLLFLQPLS